MFLRWEPHVDPGLGPRGRIGYVAAGRRTGQQNQRAAGVAQDLYWAHDPGRAAHGPHRPDRIGAQKRVVREQVLCPIPVPVAKIVSATVH